LYEKNPKNVKRLLEKRITAQLNRNDADMHVPKSVLASNKMTRGQNSSSPSLAEETAHALSGCGQAELLPDAAKDVPPGDFARVAGGAKARPHNFLEAVRAR
jgi:hypothetical protein